MAADVINLKRERRRRAAEAARLKAAENSARHGETATQKALRKARAAQEARKIEARRLDRAASGAAAGRKGSLQAGRTTGVGEMDGTAAQAGPAAKGGPADTQPDAGPAAAMKAMDSEGRPGSADGSQNAGLQNAGSQKAGPRSTGLRDSGSAASDA
jgi:hypothetical protein